MCWQPFILLASHVFYFTIGHHAIKKTVVNGTNTNPVSYNDKDFLAKLKSMYPEVYSHLDKSGDQEHYIIPGLEQTQTIVHSGKNAGESRYCQRYGSTRNGCH